METKTKKRRYLKFEQNAVIILDDIDSRSIPVKDLKICELCTLTWKRPVYHYSPSAPAKPATTISGRKPLKSLKSKKDSETGGGFTIIHMDKITDKKD